MKKRRRERIDEERETEAALESLGFGKDRYYFDDESEEEVTEKEELRAINALHWEM